MKFIPILITILIVFSSCNQQNEDPRSEFVKQTGVTELMGVYEDCKLNSSSRNECKHFIAQAICEYNKIYDFMNEDGTYIDYQGIYASVLENEKWKKIGEANQQSVLTDAQTLANDGLPVIAVNTSDEHKFTVLVINGELKASKSWGLKTPNTAAFFPVSGPKSYINKPLSYSWSNPKGIILFVRK